MKRIIVFVWVLAFSATVSVGAVSASVSNWLNPNGDPGRTNQGLTRSLPKYLGSAWSIPVVSDSPTVVYEGKVIVKNTSTSLIGIDMASGKLLWNQFSDKPLWGVDSNGIVHTSASNTITKFNSTTGEWLESFEFSDFSEFQADANYEPPQGNVGWNPPGIYWAGYQRTNISETGVVQNNPSQKGLFDPSLLSLPGDCEFHFLLSSGNILNPKFGPVKIGQSTNANFSGFSHDLQRALYNVSGETVCFYSDCLFECAPGQEPPTCSSDGFCGSTACGGGGNVCNFDDSEGETGEFQVNLSSGSISTSSEPTIFVFRHDAIFYVSDNEGDLRALGGSSLGVKADRYRAVVEVETGLGGTEAFLILAQPLEVHRLANLPGSAGLPVWKDPDFVSPFEAAGLKNGTFLITANGFLFHYDIQTGEKLFQLDGRTERPGSGNLDGGFSGVPIPLENGVVLHRRVPSGSFGFDTFVEFLGTPAGYPNQGHQSLGNFLINSLTGNNIQTRTDLSLPGRGLSLELKRTYNSARSDISGLFGKGWCFNYEASLSAIGHASVVVNRPDGGASVFTMPGGLKLDELNSAQNITLNAGIGVSDRLERLPSDEDAGFVMSDKAGVKYFFKSLAQTRGDDPAAPPAPGAYAEDGKIQAIEDPNGNRIVFNYSMVDTPKSKIAVLDTIVDTTGRTLRFAVVNAQAGAPRITRIDGPEGFFRSYTYFNGALSQVHGPEGVIAHYTNNIFNGKLETAEDRFAPEGQKEMSYKYDGDTGRIAEASPVGCPQCLTTYTYSDEPNLPAGTFPDEWDDFPATRIETVIDGAKSKVVLELYDLQGRVSDHWAENDDPESPEVDYLKTHYDFDARNNLFHVVNSSGAQTTYIYSEDGRNNLLEMIDSHANVMKYEYDENELLIKATDPRGVVTEYEYDDKRNLRFERAGVEIPGGLLDDGNLSNGGVLTTEYVYDSLGQRTQMIDPKGLSYFYEYDPNGNLSKVTAPENRVTRYFYDQRSRKIRDTNPRGKDTTYKYTPANQLESITGPSGATIRYGYDSNGNMTSVTDEDGRTTTFVYNAVYPDRDLLEQSIEPGGATTTFEYDLAGNKTRMTNAKGASTVYEYNELNRLVKVIDPMVTAPGLSGHIDFEYDAGGRMTKAVSSQGTETLFSYDVMGRLVNYRQGSVQFQYAYDKNGNLQTQAYAGNRLILYFYDAHNRPVRTQYLFGTNTPQYQFDATFDKNGNTEKLKWFESNQLKETLDYSYNDVNELTKAPAPGISSIFKNMEYDKNGNLTRLFTTGFVKNNYNVSYIYDNADRITKVLQGGSTVADYTYTTSGDLTDIAYANGTQSKFTYEPSQGRLQSIRHHKGANNLYQVSYGYDELSNVTSQTDDLGLATFSYDELNRLISAEYPATGILQVGAAAIGNPIVDPKPYKISYEYDEIGNRLKKHLDKDGQTFTTQYNYTGNLLTSRSGAETGGYGYAAGYLTSKPGGSLQYDAAMNVVNAGGVKFFYGPGFERYKREEADGEETFYVTNGSVAILELGSDKKVKTELLRDMSNKVIRKREYAEGTSETESKDLYYHSAKLGNVVALSSEDGILVQRYHYLPFGTVMEGADNKNRFRFTGREEIDEIGLSDFGGRWLDAEIGRFVQPDSQQNPILSSSQQNRYVFVRNNPLSRREIDGNNDEEVESTGGFFAALMMAVQTGLDMISSSLEAKPEDDIVINENIYKKQNFGDTSVIRNVDLNDPLAPNTWDQLDQKWPENVSPEDLAFPSKGIPNWVDEVRPGGKSDFKKGNQPQFENFGNYAYGVTAAREGIPVVPAKMAAGVVQILQGRSQWKFAPVFIRSPISEFGNSWGDDPRDQFYIELGAQNYEKFRNSFNAGE